VSNPIKVATLGFWHVHAAEYANRARQDPDTELVAVWDEDAERGKAAAEALEVVFLDDLDAVLGSDHIEAVTVTTATSEHHAIMLRAAQAGKHIFTEKLLAPTVAAAEDIIEAAERAGIALIVSLPRLYHGYTRAIIEQLEQGGLGDLTFSRIRLSHDGAIAGWLPERFYDPTRAVGGALSDLGCHPAYLTQLFLGTLPETVSATEASRTNRQGEDQAIVIRRYPNGLIGVIETGFLSRDPLSIEIHGTSGSLAYESTGNLLRMRSAGAEAWQQERMVSQDEADPFSRWVSYIRDGGRDDDNLTRAVELTRLVSAANAAAAAGTTVRYPIGVA